jgi:hypothetical protein
MFPAQDPPALLARVASQFADLLLADRTGDWRKLNLIHSMAGIYFIPLTLFPQHKSSKVFRGQVSSVFCDHR